LEKAAPEGGDDAEGEESSAAPAEKDDLQSEFDDSWTGNEREAEPPPDFDAGSGMATVGAGGSHSFEENENGFEAHLSRPVTLRDHLLEQLNMSFDDPRDRLIGAQLIDMLDEGGYVRHGVEDLAARIGCK